MIKNHLLTIGVSATVASLGFINSAEAAAIRGATSVTVSSGTAGSSSVNNMIDQSGLDVTYNDGDNLASYLSQNPLHGDGQSVEWFSNFGAANNLPLTIDYDLGATYSLTDIVLWNDEGPEGIQDFNLIVSDFSDFNSATSIGSFTAANNSFVPYPAESFSFSAVDAQYVRLEVLSNYGSSNYVALGEAAFGVAVPEPMTVLGSVVAVGFGALFKRQRDKES